MAPRIQTQLQLWIQFPIQTRIQIRIRILTIIRLMIHMTHRLALVPLNIVGLFNIYLYVNKRM